MRSLAGQEQNDKNGAFHSTFRYPDDLLHIENTYVSRVMRKPMFLFPTWSDTNRAEQLQKIARDMKFQI